MVSVEEGMGKPWVSQVRMSGSSFGIVRVTETDHEYPKYYSDKAYPLSVVPDTKDAE